MLPDQFFEFLSGIYPGLPPAYFTFFEEHERRHASYLILGSNLWIFVHIDFDYGGGVAYPFFELGQGRSLYLAGAAPLGVEIDQHWPFLIDDLFESHISQLFRLKVENSSAPVAAPYRVLLTGLDVMAQVPEAHPTNCQ